MFSIVCIGSRAATLASRLGRSECISFLELSLHQAVQSMLSRLEPGSPPMQADSPSYKGAPRDTRIPKDDGCEGRSGE